MAEFSAKSLHGGKELEAVKWLNLAEKRPENFFYKYLDENHIIICYFLDFL
jgi:hypothetical protein